MLNNVLELADAFSLTVEGAHQMFGYHLDELRTLDEELNSGRTHIIDVYPFHRDLRIDLPGQLANEEVFARDASLKELVLSWQNDVPIRVLSEMIGWQSPNVSYVRVGLEDSLGSGLPPGSLASVQSVSQAEASRPDPRAIYLLQFGNGYRCSRCVVSGTKLLLISSGTLQSGPREFLYPSAVRIVGRIRFFALRLPARAGLPPNPLPPTLRPAPLVLPWEHRSLATLFSAKHSRFWRSRLERMHVRESLESAFQSELSQRTARRYRRPTSSVPHVNTLMQLSVTHFARYSDSIKIPDLRRSDFGRFSLESLLQSQNLPEPPITESAGHLPIPLDRWEYLCRMFVEWPTLLSLRIPRLEALSEKVVRLAYGTDLPNLHPPIGPGSLLLLEPVGSEPVLHQESKLTGWQRPIYVHRSRGRIACGYLEFAGNRLALVGAGAVVHVSLPARSYASLERVAGIVIPLRESP